MSATNVGLASDKEMLLMRSALCRLRLRRATHDLRDALDWKRAVVAAASAPAVRRSAFGFALSVVGLGRGARLLMLAGRIVLIAKVARSTLEWARRGVSSVRNNP